MDPIKLEILWKRLIATVDEGATALVRTAFSPVIRDANDYGVALFDADCNLVAQCTLGTPGLISASSIATKAVGKAYPPESMKNGDVLITNDPWISGGHLNDINIITPIFHNGRLVAYAACIAHELDIGGRLITVETREIYEEGLFIPILKLFDAGQPNETVFSFIRSNIRMPDLVIGDLRAQMSANHTIAVRLNAILDEYGMADIQELSKSIMDLTESAFRNKLSQLPEGTCHHEAFIDVLEGEPIKIAAAVTLGDGQVTIDYSGSSAQVAKGINVCLGFTHATSMIAIRMALFPDLPSNEGTLKGIKVISPEGSILNARYPSAVGSRSSIAQYLPEVIFGALAQLVPNRVIAGSGSSPTTVFSSTGQRQNGKQFMLFSMFRGGVGARYNSDGVSVLAFPGNGACTPVEILEGNGPFILKECEFEMDSAGAGRCRGGCGLRVVIMVQEGSYAPSGQIISNIRGSRIHFSVPGLLGGGEAKKGISIVNGTPLKTSGGTVTLLPGGLVELRVPGGGGYGDPFQREIPFVEEDLRSGLISEEAAMDLYGVVVDRTSFKADLDATKSLRARTMAITSK